MLFGDEIHIDPAYRAALRAAGLADVPSALGRFDGRIIAWSRTTATLHFPGRGEQPGYFVKRYLYPRWKHRLRGFIRGTFFGQHRARLEFELLNDMRTRGIPAVRPVACGARRRGHFVCASFLITEEVPASDNLTCFSCRLQRNDRPLSFHSRRLATTQLAAEITALHRTNFAHGQLYWRNVLIRPNPVEGFDYFFLDPRPLRARQYTYRGERVARDELGQFLVSAQPFTTRTERMRFFRAYLGVKRLGPNDKMLAREIESLHQRRLRHEQQRIRMSRLFEQWQAQLKPAVASRLPAFQIAAAGATA